MKTQVLIELKKQGVQNIASIVAKHFNTTYYHVVSIDSLIANNGKWIASRKQCHTFKNGGYKNIRIGVSSKHVDWNCTILKMQYAKIEKDFLLKCTQQ